MAVELNTKGHSHAKSLVGSGKVDRDSSWSFSAEDGDKLGDPGSDAYQSWFMGHDTGEDPKTKAAWKYPFGKGGKVYRSAIIAIESRAAQQGATAIADAAKALLADIDKDKKSDDFLRGPRLPRSAGTRKWFRIDVRSRKKDAEPGSEPEKEIAADVNVYDAIGSWFDGVSAKDFIAALGKLPENVKTINLHVNSPGGDVFEAVAISNALAMHPAQVVTTIEGIAASAATIITQGGSDKITIGDNAMVMIHNPFALAIGDADEMLATAEMLSRIKDTIVATYARKSKIDPKKMSEMMDAETWMTADEAVTYGFADSKTDFKAQAVASIDPRGLDVLRVPAHLSAQVAALVKTSEPAKAPTQALDSTGVMDACLGAGLDLAFARSLAGQTAESVVALVAGEAKRRKDEETRCAEIRALCSTAGHADLADSYIEGGMAVPQVRTQLLAVTAKLDKSKTIDSAIVEGQALKGPVIDTVAIYAERNKLVRAH